jgi:hypothetical protein
VPEALLEVSTGSLTRTGHMMWGGDNLVRASPWSANARNLTQIDRDLAYLTSGTYLWRKVGQVRIRTHIYIPYTYIIDKRQYTYVMCSLYISGGYICIRPITRLPHSRWGLTGTNPMQQPPVPQAPGAQERDAHMPPHTYISCFRCGSRAWWERLWCD